MTNLFFLHAQKPVLFYFRKKNRLCRSCTALRKNINERKCGIFRQIFDAKSGYRESNPLCPACQEYRCFLFLCFVFCVLCFVFCVFFFLLCFSVLCFFLISVYQIFSGMQIFACFFHQMALSAGSIALFCFRSPATPYLQKKGSCLPSLLFFLNRFRFFCMEKPCLFLLLQRCFQLPLLFYRQFI